MVGIQKWSNSTNIDVDWILLPAVESLFALSSGFGECDIFARFHNVLSHLNPQKLGHKDVASYPKP